MTAKINISYPRRIIFILSGAFLFFLLTNSTYSQGSQQLTGNDFKIELRSALNSNDDKLADSIILNNRLLVKPFVDGLINEAISLDLSGKRAESDSIHKTADKAAGIFQRIFKEKSLAIGVQYLTIWLKDQKKEKLIADSLNAAGTKLRGSEPEKAVADYNHALTAYRSIGDDRGVADILGGLALIYYNLQDFKTSLGYYKDALVVRLKVDDKLLTGNSLNMIGAIYLNELPDYEQALHFLDSAEIVRTEIGDPVSLGRTVQAKASAFDKLNMTEQALLYFNKSLEINKKVGDQERVAEALLHSGTILNSTGKYSEALENFEKALEIYQALDMKPRICEVLIHTGYVYSNLGDYNTAVEKLSEALKISNETDDKKGVAGAYNNLGIVLQNAGRLDKAREYFENSLKTWEEIGDQENPITVLSNLGTVYFALNDYSKAADYHRRGLELSRKINDKESEAHCLLNLANDLIRLGKLEESMSSYEKGLQIARASDSPELTWKIIAGMAENHEMRGEIEKAVELNDTALKFLDGIRKTIKGDKLKVSFMAAERYAFEDIINMLADLHLKYPDKGYDLRAFRYAEESKARAFLDLLTESGANVKEGGYTGLKYPEPVSLKEVQKMCPDKRTVFLEYSVGDSSSCLWVITKADHQLFRLPGANKIQEQIETIRFALLDPKQDASDFFAKAGCLLYEELIKPAEPYLSAKSRLVIIPDGILNYLPFEVLLTDNKQVAQKASYSALPFLVRKYPVSYGQSASVLKNLLSEQKKAGTTKPGNKQLLVFGDPVSDSKDVPLFAAPVSHSRLEYSGQEVKKIAALFKEKNSEIYLGKNATEENLKRNGNLNKFNYIHFATHGSIDEDKPDFSSLILAKGANSTEDGFLQATEIFNLKINADLVVLSACQTGLDKLVRGEGMIGLTRAFMYAGTPSVLASLWSVSDLSTATLMEGFYRSLIKNKLSKTEALRKSQLALMRDARYAHPFYWAPFVLFGDWK